MTLTQCYSCDYTHFLFILGHSTTTSIKDHPYLLDHVINGRVLYPAAGFILLAWQSFAKMEGQDFNELPITIKDFKIHHASVIPQTGTLSSQT